MRKILYVLGMLVGLAIFLLAIFRVEERQFEGFVGPDILWESDSFYAVYGLRDGEFLSNVNQEYRDIGFNPFGGLTTQVGNFTYFGYKPSIGDVVRIREYNVWYRWFDKEHWGENFSLTFVQQLPLVSHAQAIVPQLTFTVTVDFAEPEPGNQELVGKTMYVSQHLADVQNPSMEYLGEPTYIPGEPVKILSVHPVSWGTVVTVLFTDGRQEDLDLSWLSEWKWWW